MMTMTCWIFCDARGASLATSAGASTGGGPESSETPLEEFPDVHPMTIAKSAPVTRTAKRERGMADLLRSFFRDDESERVDDGEPADGARRAVREADRGA